MLKRVFIISISLFLLVCSVFLAQTVFEKYIQEKETIVLVQSDLFKDVSYINLDELIKDEYVKNLFLKEDKIDIDFKIALFYSDLSIVMYNKARSEKNLSKYVGGLYGKSVQKWDDLIKKDKSMLFFKNYYLKTYSENVKFKTN